MAGILESPYRTERKGESVHQVQSCADNSSVQAATVKTSDSRTEKVSGNESFFRYSFCDPIAVIIVTSGFFVPTGMASPPPQR